MISSRTLREKYLNFFKAKGHAILPSSSLIPENDPTVLFTTAGMHPLVPYLLGQKHPQGNRLASVQKCVRTGDIEEVGDNRHLTFFEMLGNWSLGDYWKNESISWSWEFLTSKDQLSIDPARLAVSVFAGDKDAPRDEESAKIWQELGVPKPRIAFLPKSDNWWGPAGLTGPCGPDTEIFYWTGTGQPPQEFDPKSQSGQVWVEIWNNVFMEYYKNEQGQFELARQRNVDAGMGLERTAAILNDFDNVYEIDSFKPLIQKVNQLSKSPNLTLLRQVADHSRAATFIAASGIEPSNKEQGYVLRRLVRSSLRQARKLGIDQHTSIFTELTPLVIDQFKDVYKELSDNKDKIITSLVAEEKKFEKTLNRGLSILDRKLARSEPITAQTVFDLYQTYGFPFELTQAILKERNQTIDRVKFEEELKKHQELSRTASSGKYKGGLADHKEATTKLHTAAHLLHMALRQVLGEYVSQRGSNITSERLRFDFSQPRKLTDQEVAQVEDLVNRAINSKLSVEMDELPLSEAKTIGALGVFDSKYGEKVKVYTILDNNSKEVFSREICGGPHIKNTGELGKFSIIKQESISVGTRRLKAVLS